MHQELERALGVLLLQDLGHDRVRLAGVHHQGNAELARRRHVGPEHPRLDVARAEIVMEVEPRLADADDLGAARQLAQGIHAKRRIFLGFVRMRPDRAPDVLMGHGHGVDRLEGRDLVADGQHQLHARSAGALDHVLAVGVELMRMQIDVAVDQHLGRPPKRFTRGPLRAGWPRRSRRRPGGPGSEPPPRPAAG